MDAVHTPILQMTGITKQFPGVKALSMSAFACFRVKFMR